MSILCRHIARWGGILGALGGLIWALLFLVEAMRPHFDLSCQLQNLTAVGLVLVFGVVLQGAGFYSLSAASMHSSAPRISVMLCSVGALVQSFALLAVSILGFGAAWIFGILGELVITLALGSFAVMSLSSNLPAAIKVLPFLMVPSYYVGWAIDPAAGSVAGFDLVNLSAAVYGLLWIPFGYLVWSYLRNRIGNHRIGESAS